MVPIFTDPKVLAWPGHIKARNKDIAQYYPLDEMLTTRFECDAHFSQYSVPILDRRLDSDALGHEALPDGVPMALIVFDIDQEESHKNKTEASNDWRQVERAKVEKLFLWAGAGVYYETKKGYRLVFQHRAILQNNDDKEQWREEYFRACCLLAQRYLIVCDPACSDWTRLFRCPHATRDGRDAPEERLLLGDPKNVGFWNPLDTLSDEECLVEADKQNPTRDKHHGWWKVQRAFLPAPKRQLHLVDAPSNATTATMESTPESTGSPNARPQSEGMSATTGNKISIARPYALTALRREEEQLRRADKQKRTKALEGAALRLFALVKANALERPEVEKVLREGCSVNGWIRDYSQSEFARQLGNWWEMAEARDLSKVGKEVDEDKAMEIKAAFKLSDTGNAERFVARHGENVRYCFEWEKWFIWDGSRWSADRVGSIDQLAKETARSIYQEAWATEDEDKRKTIAKWALRSESAQTRKQISVLAKSEPGIPVLPEQLDPDVWLLNLPNGTLDLRTGELRDADRCDLITKRVSVAYDAAARCPLWEAFLLRVMDYSPEKVAYLQRAIGYALTGSTREHCFFLLFGTGKNGKSTFLEICRALIADYGQKAEVATFLAKKNDSGPRNDLAMLRGARFVSAAEPEGGARLAEGLIKEVTGGDTIRARFLYQETFEFQPQFKLFLAANSKPVVRGTDEGIWRRIRLIPFTVTIPPEERDLDLGAKLLQELPGILNWAIEGCLRWQQSGLAEPEEISSATGEYRDEQDILGDFLLERCELSSQGKVAARELYKAYRSYCGDVEEPLSETTFAGKLEGKGLTKKRTKQGMVWLGVSVKEV